MRVGAFDPRAVAPRGAASVTGARARWAATRQAGEQNRAERRWDTNEKPHLWQAGGNSSPHTRVNIGGVRIAGKPYRQ
jgi:hypothetical protein